MHELSMEVSNMKKAMMMLAAVAAGAVLPVHADGVNAFLYIQK